MQDTKNTKNTKRNTKNTVPGFTTVCSDLVQMVIDKSKKYKKLPAVNFHKELTDEEKINLFASTYRNAQVNKEEYKVMNGFIEIYEKEIKTV